jgi:hypothetical protein
MVAGAVVRKPTPLKQFGTLLLPTETIPKPGFHTLGLRETILAGSARQANSGYGENPMKLKKIVVALSFLSVFSGSAAMAAFSIPSLTGDTANTVPANPLLDIIADNPDPVAPPPGNTAVPVVPDNPVTRDPGNPGNWWMDTPPNDNSTGVLPVIPLNTEEAATLLHMREEEKLARDVYLTLFDTWDFVVFENIAGSEQKHMDTMLSKVETYDLVDPVTDNAVGAFETEEFTALYDELTSDGAQSLEAALMAGGLIEELDILDLQRAIEESEHQDIIQAYENLLRGSRNHLRQFASQVENLGLIYEAQLMTQEEVDEIINSPMERGGRGH